VVIRRLTALAIVIFTWLPTTHAHSVQLGKAGVGEVLVFPFFNANMGWDTYLDITFDGGNTPQIVKIHVREGIDGDIVNSFNLYQLYNDANSGQPASNWRAAITKDSQGNPMLRIAEGPCTLSDQMTAGGKGTTFPLNTSVGSIEMYAISAKLTPGVDEVVTTCDQILDRWGSEGAWTANPDADLEEITGNELERNGKRLAGQATLIHVRDGLSAGYAPLAFQNFSDRIAHSAPDAAFPTLADADPTAELPGNEEFVPQSGEGIDAIAALMAASLSGFNATRDFSDESAHFGGQVTNQVIQSNAVGARTEWVISYPLDGYKPYRPFEVSVGGETRRCETLGASQAVRASPLIQEQAEAQETVDISYDYAFQIVESWGGGKKIEGQPLDITPVPPTPVKTAICYATNILGFEGQDSVLIENDSPNLYRLRNAILANPESSTFRWRIFDPELFPEILRPVVGFRLTVFKNGTLNGGSTLANYAILQPHYTH